MRHYFTNDSRPKAVAKALRTELARYGYRISHSEALLLTAKIYGYRNWSDLLASIGTRPPSPDDHEAEISVAEARFSHHVETIVAAGVPREVAIEVVRKIGPTSSAARGPHTPEELWTTDEAVVSYLEGVARAIAANAREVVSVSHGTWIGFRAAFDREQWAALIPPSVESLPGDLEPSILFGVSFDGRSVICRINQDTEFPKAVEGRSNRRDKGSPNSWEFISNYRTNVVGRNSLEAAGRIMEVFSRLDPASLRALRSAWSLHEDDYERMVASPRLRAFLNRYPALADRVIWAWELPDEIAARGKLSWIERNSPETAIKLLMMDGKMPSGTALERVNEVAKALEGYSVRSGRSDLFSENALRALAHLGPSAIPASKREMSCLISSAAQVTTLVKRNGMDIERAYDGFKGNWEAFYRASHVGESRLDSWWPEAFTYLICDAFGNAYGIDPDILHDENFSEAVVRRLAPMMMSRMSMLDIARLGSAIISHPVKASYFEGDRSLTLAEADEIAALFTLPMTEEFHGKGCLEILKLAGYDTDALAGMLKLEPDLEFDDDGMPVIEARFAGLDPSTYAVKPLAVPGFKAEKPVARRPEPMVPPEIPEAPPGWRFEGGEFRSTGRYLPSRIRWSDGKSELVGSGSGWYADRGLGDSNRGGEPRCPVRLGRFGTPAEAAQAITNAKGHSG